MADKTSIVYKGTDTETGKVEYNMSRENNLQTQQDITLDFSVPRIKNVRCKEGDAGSRVVNITVTNQGEIYPLDAATMTARYKVHKPDHTYIYHEVPIKADGTVTIQLPEQAMAVAGTLHAELQIADKTSTRISSSTGASVNGGSQPDIKILSTMPFRIIVEKSVLSGKDIESATESAVIDGMIAHMADYDNPHLVTKAQVGLGRADNTPDVEKHVHSAVYAENDPNGNTIHSEILAAAQPGSQKEGDYWLQDY